MNNIKLILVEDSEADAELCKNAIEDFNEDNSDYSIELKVVRDASSAIEALRSSHYDGAIVDMKLANDGNNDEGNLVLQEIKNQLRRVPVVVMTGTKHVVEFDNNEIPLVGQYTKGGDISYKNVIDELSNIYKTGLTRIMGGIGEIEKSLSEIFIKNLLRQIVPTSDMQSNSWIEYAKNDAASTEKALLRYTLNHLIHYLYDNGRCYPNEMYIYLYPPMKDEIDTGCILKEKDTDKLYIVMSPSCDLAVREGGSCNTDRALLVTIQKIEEIKEFQDKSWDEIDNCKSMKNTLAKIRKNNQNLYYYWLPPTSLFYKNGAVVNFRWLYTYNEDELKTKFEPPRLQISSPFLKDIISRFSSYYARQGQPDINYE